MRRIESPRRSEEAGWRGPCLTFRRYAANHHDSRVTRLRLVFW